MNICVLMISDGRPCHEEARVSLEANLPAFSHVVHVDDSSHTLGFTGAVIESWRQVIATGAEYVWHAELDFIYNRRVPLQRMIACLQRHPHLTQMTLKRQPVNEEECAAGGIVEAHPEQYTEMFDGIDTWTETDRFVFSTNPSVYPARLCELGWPNERESEGKFGALLRRLKPEARSGIWGAKFDPPRVEHIGARVGVGY